MKVFRIAILVLLALTICAAAFADDLNPPVWRGQPGTTFGKWEFSTPDPNPVPEPGYIYPFGMPTTEVYPGYMQQWQPTLNGRLGVWPLSGEIWVTIPNSPIPNPVKNIWVQLTWNQQAPNVQPLVTETRFGAPSTEVQRLPLAGGWFHSTYLITLQPNPEWEKILISGAVNVDEMVIDTQCAVPEPSTFLALGTLLAPLALRRRRK